MSSTFTAVLLLGVLATVLAANGGALQAFKGASNKASQSQEQFNKCLDETSNSLTEEEKAYLINDVLGHQITVEPTKRLWLCVFTASGIMKDNKFDKEGFVKFATQDLEEGDKDYAKKLSSIKETAELCEKQVGAGGDTPQETATMIFTSLNSL